MSFFHTFLFDSLVWTRQRRDFLHFTVYTTHTHWFCVPLFGVKRRGIKEDSKFIDCRHIAKCWFFDMSTYRKTNYNPPSPKKVSKHVIAQRHPNVGLVGTCYFICNATWNVSSGDSQHSSFLQYLMFYLQCHHQCAQKWSNVPTTQKGLTCGELNQQLERLHSLRLMEEALESKTKVPPKLNRVIGGDSTQRPEGGQGGGKTFGGNPNRRGLPAGLDVSKVGRYFPRSQSKEL